MDVDCDDGNRHCGVAGSQNRRSRLYRFERRGLRPWRHGTTEARFPPPASWHLSRHQPRWFFLPIGSRTQCRAIIWFIDCSRTLLLETTRPSALCHQDIVRRTSRRHPPQSRISGCPLFVRHPNRLRPWRLFPNYVEGTYFQISNTRGFRTCDQLRI